MQGQDPDDDAVRRMLDGDDDAFRTVYRGVQPRLQRYLTALVGQDDAEDVASETWAQACRSMHQFSGDADGFRGWISTIGRHRALDHLRAKGRRPLADIPLDELVDRAAPDNVERSVEDILSTEAAINLITGLPAEQAEAVLLRTVMGLDAKAAGAVLGRSAGAVRTAAYRGLRTLADQAERLSSDTFAVLDAEEL